MEPLEVRTLLVGEFTDLGALEYTGVTVSSVAWGDMDNDGDLDILLTGSAARDPQTLLPDQLLGFPSERQRKLPTYTQLRSVQHPSGS